jgi:hypothetical protein
VMSSFERGDELSGSIQYEELLPSLGTISFSRRTLLHGVVNYVTCVVHALQLACATKETHQ